MTLVALQPSASAASRKHFQDTINTGVSIDVASRFLPPSEIEMLRKVHPDGQTNLWGAKPGERMQQVAKWSRLRPGDYIAFAAEGRLFAGAAITAVFRSPDLASELWGDTSTANGRTQTWELMFALADIETLDLKYEVLNDLIGRKPGANVQEFAVLGDAQSASLLDYLNRAENRFQGVEAAATSLEPITAALEETDREVTVMRRLEQAAIKRALLSRPISECELCGRPMSAEFLTAAHIKRRSRCTPSERNLLTAVAMLNCRFGCDELFGKGYVGVDEHGVIQVSALLRDHASRTYATDLLEGRKATAWSRRSETHEFFRFHWDNDFRRVVTAVDRNV